jgi:trehalose 6-phosphate synthase
MMSVLKKSSFVVAANRLPVRWDEQEEEWHSSPGGLVSALRPILQEREGTWVGWTGQPDQELAPFEHDSIEQHPVALSAGDIENYYHGFCNATIWPLYHNAIRTPEYHRHWWRPYETVNRRFAEEIVEAVEPDGTVWIHDYHLQLVPFFIREECPDARIGFFLHIPFPPIELFGYLPWRREVLRGLLGADVVAFQTKQGVDNFTEAAARFLGARPVTDGLEHDGRFVRLQWSPIAVDTGAFERLARSSEVQAHADSIHERRNVLRALSRHSIKMRRAPDRRPDTRVRHGLCGHARRRRATRGPDQRAVRTPRLYSDHLFLPGPACRGTRGLLPCGRRDDGDSLL